MKIVTGDIFLKLMLNTLKVCITFTMIFYFYLKQRRITATYLRPLSKNKYSIDETLTFSNLLKNAAESDDYEDVSYNIKNLFACVPVKEKNHYIKQKIYVKKKIKPLCRRSIFQKTAKET